MLHLLFQNAEFRDERRITSRYSSGQLLLSLQTLCSYSLILKISANLSEKKFRLNG